MSNSISRIEAARSLTDTSGYDRLRDAVLIGTNAIPIAGGPIAQMLSSVIPDWRIVRIQKFLQDLALDFELQKTRIDEVACKSTEFTLAYMDTLRRIEFETSDHKQRAFRATLLNAVLPNPPSIAVQEIFRKWIAEMSEIQIVAVSRIYCKQELIDPLTRWLQSIPKELLLLQLDSLPNIRLGQSSTWEQLLPDLLDPKVNFGDENHAYSLLIESSLMKQFLKFISL